MKTGFKPTMSGVPGFTEICKLIIYSPYCNRGEGNEISLKP